MPLPLGRSPSLHCSGKEALEAEGLPGWGRPGNCAPPPPQSFLSGLATPGLVLPGLVALLHRTHGLPWARGCSGQIPGLSTPGQILLGKGRRTCEGGSLPLQPDSELRRIGWGRGYLWEPGRPWVREHRGTRAQVLEVWGREGSSGAIELRSPRELGHLGCSGSDHSHRKWTYQMVCSSAAAQTGGSPASVAMSQ